MEQVAGALAPPDRRWTIQIVITCVWVALMAAVVVLGLREDEQERVNAFDVFAAIVSVIAHASWITLDCQRNRHSVGWWRFGAILFGPFAIWLYLGVGYGRRALYLIPVSMLVYAAPLLIGLGFAVIFNA